VGVIRRIISGKRFLQFIVLVLWLVSPGPVHAAWNAVSLSDTVITFGAVSTADTHSVLITITNNLTVPVQVQNAGFEGNEFFTDLGTPEIPALSCRDFNVYFSSRQNIDHADFLRIEVSGGMRPLLAEVTAEAHYSGTYYSSTRNKWGEELKDALTDIIDDHNSLGYTLARDHMYGHIDNVDGWVECVYTGRTAYFNTRQGATENGFNCEHTWPQSFSDEAEPMKSDLFHLYPTDATANNYRANLDFGVVTSVTWSSGGSKLGTDSEGQTVFEPRDAHKGNVARTHFYYIIRYDGNYNYYTDPAKMEAHFRDWHVADPVDSAEELRNEEIYALQFNRNPFIDHPELVDRISSFFGTAVHTLEPNIAMSPGEVYMGTVAFDTTAHYYVAFMNCGDDTLNISSITSCNPDFTPDVSSLCLAPGCYEYVGVCYSSPNFETTDSTSIIALSDDCDESSIEIPVTVTVSDLSGVAPGHSVPGGLTLYQNSPNPFAGRTSIAFELGRAGKVDLCVYDTLGRLVERILDNVELAPGPHRVEFSPNGIQSGVYFCRLQTGGAVVTMRMVVLN
jgi:deoxyribonuclease-1